MSSSSVSRDGLTSRSTEELIKSFQDEYSSVQKKTFVRWINLHLAKVNDEISDILQDLRDGTRLVKLLEILSGESFQPSRRGSLRIHSIQEVERVLSYLDQKLQVPLRSMMNIGAEDIVDGNEKITLGIVWLLILRFQMQLVIQSPTTSAITSATNVYQDNNSNNDSTSDVLKGYTSYSNGSKTENSMVPSRKVKSTNFQKIKQNLLSWLQDRLLPYSQEPFHIEVTDFQSECWRNGLAFSATLHSFNPDLISGFPTLVQMVREVSDSTPVDEEKKRATWIDTLERAFSVADEYLGIPRLLEASDLVDTNRIDEHSLTTYFSNYYIMIRNFEKKQKELYRSAQSVEASSSHSSSNDRVITSSTPRREASKSGRTVLAGNALQHRNTPPSFHPTDSEELTQSISQLSISSATDKDLPPVPNRSPDSQMLDDIDVPEWGRLRDGFQEITQKLQVHNENLDQLLEDTIMEDYSSSNGAQIGANNIKIVLSEQEPAFLETLSGPYSDWMKECHVALKRHSSFETNSSRSFIVQLKQWIKEAEMEKERTEKRIKDHQESFTHLEQLATVLKAMETRKAFLVNVELQLISGEELYQDDLESINQGVDSILSDFTLLMTSVRLLKEPFRKAAIRSIEELKHECDKIRKRLPTTRPSRPASAKGDHVHAVLLSLNEWLTNNTKTLKRVHDSFKNDAFQSYADILKHINEVTYRNDTDRFAKLRSELLEKEDSFKGIKFTATQKPISPADKELIPKAEKLLAEFNLLMNLEKYRIHQSRKIYKFHKAAQEVENWLTAAKLAILSVPIDLSKGLEQNPEIKSFEEKLKQFEPTVNTLLLMNDKLSVDPTSNHSASEGEHDSLATEKQYLHEKYSKLCNARAKDISELWRVLLKTVDDINQGYRKAYKLSKLTEAFQTVTSTLNGVEKEQMMMENNKKLDRDRLNMFESSLNDVGVALERLQQDLSANKEIESVVGGDLKKLQGTWQASKHRNQNMLQRVDQEKKIFAYTQIADKVDSTIEGLYETVTTSDLQGKSYQAASTHALIMDSIERKYRAFKPSVVKMMEMLDGLIRELSNHPKIKERHEDIHQKWNVVVQAMGSTQKPTQIPMLRRPSSSSNMGSAASLSLSSSPSMDMRRESMRSQSNSPIAQFVNPYGTFRRARPRTASGASIKSFMSAASTPARNASPPPVKQSSTILRSPDTNAFSPTGFSGGNMTNETAPNSRSTTPAIPPLPHLSNTSMDSSRSSDFRINNANKYVPNPKDPLDVAVAAIVNESPFAIPVKKEEPKQQGFSASPVIAGGNKYWFGNMDTKGKAVYCRLRGNVVIVRVGGGWQALHDFLLDHMHLDTFNDMVDTRIAEDFAPSETADGENPEMALSLANDGPRDQRAAM